MLHYHSLSEAQNLFKVLSAPMRIKIMELLYEGGDRNLNDLANKLGLTNSAVSLHVKALESAGLIECSFRSRETRIYENLQTTSRIPAD